MNLTAATRRLPKFRLVCVSVVGGREKGTIN